jgi:hypothetical protein
MLVDEVAGALDVARGEPALDAAQRMAEHRAALGLGGGPVQDPGKPTAVP